MIQNERVMKPWGNFEQLVHNELCTVKILTVNPGEWLSYQYHFKRDEYWRILEGHPCVRIDDKYYYPEPNAEFQIQRRQMHQLIGRFDICRVLEISTGHFDEEDIIRLEDKYKR